MEMEEHKHDENCGCQEGEHHCCTDDKKTKNLISIAILLAGLFLGSLFVDTYQAVRGSGYSAKNLNKSEIFEANGKTWVAYGDPAVPVTVISDDKCDKCDVSDALVWLKRVLPTVSTVKVNFDSAEGKALIEKNDLKTLPAFIFDTSVEKTELFAQAAMVFDKKEGDYVLRTQDIGMPVGKYLATPQINDSDPAVGPKDAQVKVVLFSDFQCPYCKVFFQSFRDIMKQDSGNVLFAYKHLPLDIHPQAVPAALAAECAQEQNKFWEYADLLYKNQSVWGAAKDTVAFKGYARTLGLDAGQFGQCLDGKKYQNVVDAGKSEGESFGISGTPAIFVNDQFESGVISADQLKTDIENQLNK
jgi:protein-disulfide isomerase